MGKVKTVGIVGGGQLGKMLAIAAKKLGFNVVVVDPTPKSPAGQVADYQIVADFKNEKAIRKLAEMSDFLTFEVELASDDVLDALVKEGKIVNPSPKTLRLVRDKLYQKEFLKKNNIPTSAFIEINNREDVEKAIKKLGLPILLKARTDAYDGRGNFLIKKVKDIDKGLHKLATRKLYIEKFVNFKKELSVVIARNTKGEIAIYPVVETIHKDNICDLVIVPAPVPANAIKNAKKLAIKVMKHLKGSGVFAIEMFLEKGNKVLINEIAPRVHNSGHYTIEACVTSQFEQHIRAIANLPLGSTNMITKAAVMKNILGGKTGDGFPDGIEKSLGVEDASLHLYGKHESRPQRKMGHITVCGNSLNTCRQKAEKARKYLTI